LDAAGWLAHWADAEARYLAERDERYRRIGALRNLDSAGANPSSGPVVLEPAHEAELDLCPVAACRRVAAAAGACGWTVRLTRAVAAVPRVGVLESWAVRCARGSDERLWACWWNGAFNAAQYWRVGAPAVEILGGDRMGTWAVGPTPVESMTVAQIKSLAIDRGIKIPSKFNKDAVIEHVKAHGLASAPAPRPLRGVLDAIEGLQLTRH